MQTLMKPEGQPSTGLSRLELKNQSSLVLKETPSPKNIDIFVFKGHTTVRVLRQTFYALKNV
jgi:hypothetical protein